MQTESCYSGKNVGRMTRLAFIATAARNHDSSTATTRTRTVNATCSGGPSRRSSTESSLYFTLSVLYYRSYSSFRGRGGLLPFVLSYRIVSYRHNGVIDVRSARFFRNYLYAINGRPAQRRNRPVVRLGKSTDILTRWGRDKVDATTCVRLQIQCTGYYSVLL